MKNKIHLILKRTLAIAAFLTLLPVSMLLEFIFNKRGWDMENFKYVVVGNYKVWKRYLW